MINSLIKADKNYANLDDEKKPKYNMPGFGGNGDERNSNGYANGLTNQVTGEKPIDKNKNNAPLADLPVESHYFENTVNENK